ncbi:hypothetical protein TWF694_003872 [Orbilia ellipsospora]|uniref:Uncharacterized protein n=1 Tax=Orbilia ellipsospora TaxID=2528407 RepID=A0AAV9X5I1_9PEZI
MKITHIIFLAVAVSAVPLDLDPEKLADSTQVDRDYPQEAIDTIGDIVSKTKFNMAPNIVGSQYVPKIIEEAKAFTGVGQIKAAIWEGIKKFFGGKIDKAKAFYENLSPKALKDVITKSGLLSRFGFGKSFSAVVTTTAQLQANWGQGIMAGQKLRSMRGNPFSHFMDDHGNLYRGKFIQRVLDRPDNAPGGIKALEELWGRPLTRQELARKAWRQDHDSWVGIDGRNFHQIEYRKAGNRDTQAMKDRHAEANKAAQEFVDDRCKGMSRDEAFKKYWAKFHKIYDAYVTLAPGEYWQNFDQIIPVQNTTRKYCGKADPAMDFPLSSISGPIGTEPNELAQTNVAVKDSSGCEWYWGPLKIFTCDQLRARS